MFLDTTLIDQLEPDQMNWLGALERALKKQLLLPLPKLIYEAFQSRGWLEGEPTGCKLNATGAGAALRIIGKEIEAKAAEKRKGKTRRKKH